ncbi:MAG: DUF2339 domain-containing protein, partial [Defluviitaleaceae bacterium]|nr:DUF2339 domain-containing protein [Defluviitaleaceae bacterium]
QNTELKNALYEHVFNERLGILNTAVKKSDAYFKASTEGELNRLVQLERNLIGKTNALTAELKKYKTDASRELYGKLDELSAQANNVLTEARTKLAKEAGAFARHSAEEFEKLKEEQITDEVIASIGRKNNLEAFVGGNLINKLGILFVILGIIAVSQFTFFRLPDTFRGIIMFAISGVMLLAGELLSRRKANVFSLGVTSGGVAGLYASLSISYFMLEIIGMYPALALCILITFGAFVLSQRYNSQTIISFALFGGYIPIISISDSVALTYGAMVYFIILNLLALSISFYKKWKISMSLGFVLNLAGTYYIAYNMFDFISAGVPSFGASHITTILYVLFSFAIYTLIPIMGSYSSKQPFTKPDIAVLALNTFFSALLMYTVFTEFMLDDYHGVMTLAFAVIYVGLARFIEQRFAKDKRATALFYLTGLAFVILTVPMQFGMEWLSLGWLAQGVALAAYGILAGERGFKKAGLVIGALCLAAFMIFDVSLRIDDLFAYKYLAITAGSVIILAALAYKKSLSRRPETAYKYAVLVNLWFYGMYLCGLADDILWRQRHDFDYYDPHFLSGALAVAVTLLYAFLLPRLPVILDKGVKILSVALSVIGMLLAAMITSEGSVFRLMPGDADLPMSVAAAGTAALVLLCVLLLLAMRNALMFFVLESELPAEYLPFGLSLYFLIVLTQNLVWQYDLSVTSMVISIIYVTAAFTWIFYGFVKKFPFMRKFGLALSIVAVAKLFLIDLSGLTQGQEIISYFAFGAALLGISYVYQYFSKRLVGRGDADVLEASSEEADTA